MSELSEFLLPNEECLCVTRPHWIVYGLPAGFSAGTAAVLAAPIGAWEISLLFMLFAAMSWAYAYTNRRFTIYAVTNKRVLSKAGIISRATSGILLRRIESVEVYQNIPGRLLGYGNVEIRGTGGGIDVLVKVEHPFTFRRELVHILSELD